MRIHVLGSAAGGGFPQWNCNCPNCRGLRNGSLPAKPRSQSSLAISAGGQGWFLFNASPDIRNQFEQFPSLHPSGPIRTSPLLGVVLTDAELDHSLGLFSLRENGYLRLYATTQVHIALTEWNPILNTLAAYTRVDWQPLPLGETISLCGPDGQDSGLRCRAFPASSTKALLYQPGEFEQTGMTVGLRISDAQTGQAVVYLPAVQQWTETIRNELYDCQALFLDGTFWEDDELVRLGIRDKTARAMGHLPIYGRDGSLEILKSIDIPRKVYIHINNTNPILAENSAKRKIVEESGVEIAFDGMEMEL